jgi:hypothetical protein
MAQVKLRPYAACLDSASGKSEAATFSRVTMRRSSPGRWTKCDSKRLIAETNTKMN